MNHHAHAITPQQSPVRALDREGMRELSSVEIDAVAGGFDLNLSGHDGAAAIMAITTFGSLFTPIGPVTAGIAIGSAVGLSGAQVAADNNLS